MPVAKEGRYHLRGGHREEQAEGGMRLRIPPSSVKETIAVEEPLEPATRTLLQVKLRDAEDAA